MKDLTAFLNPVKVEDKEVVISNRFLDADKKPAPFVIRAITQAENDELVRRSTKTRKVNGQAVERLDEVEYSRRLVAAATVWPDFSDKELCDAYGVMNPLEVPGRMLLAGEFGRLSKEILELSELGKDLGETAKN